MEFGWWAVPTLRETCRPMPNPSTVAEKSSPTRSVELAPAGEALLERAPAILAAFSTARIDESEPSVPTTTVL